MVTRLSLFRWKVEQVVDVCWYGSENIRKNVPDVIIVHSRNRDKEEEEEKEMAERGRRRQSVLCNTCIQVYIYSPNPSTFQSNGFLFFLSWPSLLLTFILQLSIFFSFFYPVPTFTAFLVLFLLLRLLCFLLLILSPVVWRCGKCVQHFGLDWNITTIGEKNDKKCCKDIQVLHTI